MQRSKDYFAAVNPAIKVSAAFCALISSALCVFTWCGNNNNDKASINRAFEAFLCAFFIFAFIFFVCCLLKESEKEADQGHIKWQHIALTKAKIKIDSQNNAYLKLQIKCVTYLLDLKLKNSEMLDAELPQESTIDLRAISALSTQQAAQLQKLLGDFLHNPSLMTDAEQHIRQVKKKQEKTTPSTTISTASQQVTTESNSQSK
jgi:hypothetical protein